MLLPDSARELIASGALAHLVTLNRDGSPQVSAVWVGLAERPDGSADDVLLSAHLFEHQKIRNIRRDPRVALSLASPERNEIGMQSYLVVKGRAVVTEGGAPELLRTLGRSYLDGREFQLPPDPPPGFVTRITVEKVGGQGPWATGH